MLDFARFLPILLALAAVVAVVTPSSAAVSENLLQNPTLQDADAKSGVPAGWGLYAGAGKEMRFSLVEVAGEAHKVFLLEDGDPNVEIGITQTVPAKAGETYRASARVRAVEGASTGGTHLQMRFLPSGEFSQVGLTAGSTKQFETVSTTLTAPEGTTQVMLYVYSHRDPTPKLLVESVSLVSGVPPPPPPPPAPVPPQYTRLKDLHLTTHLVREGRPAVTLVAPASGIYREQAARIAGAIKAITGVAVPVLADDAPEVALPLQGNLILLGNRSTNRTISLLYDRYFCLTDLKYPGAGGFEVRTLHNPLGGGHNVILAGGSDKAGVSAAAGVLAQKLRAAGGGKGSLALGWTMEIRLGKGVVVPKELKQFETWEASKMYASSGYFGWNCISKRMAMYYMTGDPFHAREALRLAFPDKAIIEELAATDGEMIENKEDPLAGPYHYNAHMMILFWDLIEESPVFTDEERLRVTNAFARQLAHRANEGVYSIRQVPPYVGSRHGQYSAISLYCLGRYFQKDYPNRIWEQCVEGSRLAFASLNEHPWIWGESDNLFWYNTGTAPVLTFLTLSGERKPVGNGVLAELLRGQEILFCGRPDDWALRGAALDFLHKAAYLMQDGRYIYYRERAGMDTGVFRLGQSFWPDESLAPAPPEDLVGKWGIQYLPKPYWRERGNGFRPEESFYFGSYRSSVDASGDYLLMDGYNGASRNAYHTFALLEMRLAGMPILDGYHNQVLTKVDGMVEPKVPMDAALRYHDVVGSTVAAVAEVPDAAYCSWRRTLAQRVGRYALVVDDLAFRANSENVEVQTLWEAPRGAWRAKENAIRVAPPTVPALPAGWRSLRALDAKVTSEPATEGITARLDSLNIVVLRATAPGAWIEMAFDLKERFAGEVYVDFLNYADRGKVRLLLDGKPAGEEYENYAPAVENGRAPLGRHRLAAGPHRLRAEVVAQRAGSDKCFVGLMGVSLRPDGAPEPVQTLPSYAICPSDLLPGSTAGGVTTLDWRGPVRQGEHRVFFSLVGASPQDVAGAPTAAAVRCVRVADNAAALAVPPLIRAEEGMSPVAQPGHGSPAAARGAKSAAEHPEEHSGVPALAVAGEYAGTQADVAIVAADHLYGRAMTRAAAEAPLLASDAPVDVDWDYASGTVHVVAGAATQVRLALARTAGVRVDGKPARATSAPDGMVAVALAAGRHRIEGAKPATAARARAVARLTALLDGAAQERARLLAAGPAAPASAVAAAPAVEPVLSAGIGGRAVALITIPSPAGPLICAAEGKKVHVLAADGKEVRTLVTDGPVRVLHWWPEHRLLLAGCTDEKVIAFDEAGQRKWVFVSEMDPAVFRAAKQYWFKTAPGHEGVHGLHTGVFLDGKSQCFVGSACTLEILDENGKLAKRLPVFWGTGAVFQIVPGPKASLNLLIGRSITDGAHLAIVNNKDLRVVGSGFHTVPAGVTYVGGWACMSRRHLFHEDMDGSGQRRLVSEINGTWNRVTVWKEDGTALCDASFGPGDSIPARNMRDLDVADLDGDGKKEIVTATAGGLVVCLDHQCRKVWARRLDSPPTALQVAGARIVVGCQDGTVVILDGKGDVVRRAKVTGAPSHAVLLAGAAGPVVVLATDKGDVKGF